MTHKLPDPTKCEKPREMEDFCLRSGLKHKRDCGGHGVYGNERGSVAFPLHGLLSKMIRSKVAKAVAALLAVLIVYVWMGGL